MGTVISDLLCCIALLNSLSSHFPHAHSIISCDIAAAQINYCINKASASAWPLGCQAALSTTFIL
ncbi:hypothetical protein L208DRAFT_1501050 [Tricholoma matsutake]|nr:hypothetical protein L208DRAFT_1501050 [Tricholoma matsutake 945]